MGYREALSDDSRFRSAPASDREALHVQKTFKFYVIQNGQRVVRQFLPGEWLPRQDWDREASARSKRNMTNTGFVRDPLTVEINPMTGKTDPVPVGKPSVTVVNKGGVDPNIPRRPATAHVPGTRLNPKVWGDRKPAERLAGPQPVAGTRLNPKVWKTQPQAQQPAPKRRGRPPKQKA